ncbi:hypothetical protein V1291_000227 [Nitrobacteraceae bacterium AZCC 1564]
MRILGANLLLLYRRIRAPKPIAAPLKNAPKNATLSASYESKKHAYGRAFRR